MAVKYFHERDAIAGMTILSLLHPADTQNETIYYVKYDCCGNVGDRTHKSIKRKLKTGGVLCAGCNAKASLNIANKTQFKARAAQLAHKRDLRKHPTWPVPPSILADKRHFIWGDRGGR